MSSQEAGKTLIKMTNPGYTYGEKESSPKSQDYTVEIACILFVVALILLLFV